MTKRELTVLRFDDRRGAPIGCSGCHLLEECGGDTRSSDTWDCRDHCADCDPLTCTKVCLTKEREFALDYAEVGGFGLDDVGPLAQPDLELPTYIPLVQHGYSGGPVDLPWAAVSLHDIASALHLGRPGPGATLDPAALRARFGLGSATRVVVVGIGKDADIERFWAVHRRREAATLLAQLGVTCVIPPNFSLALDEPRPTHLHSKRRSLLCASAFAAAGLTAVPVVQTLTPHDWRIFEAFLRERPDVRYVAAEFQTGLVAKDRARAMLKAFGVLQANLGRRLHMIAIGGGHHRELLREHVGAVTVIDSTPWFKSMMRRRFTPGRATGRWERVPDAKPADLLPINVAGWALTVT